MFTEKGIVAQMPPEWKDRFRICFNSMEPLLLSDLHAPLSRFTSISHHYSFYTLKILYHHVLSQQSSFVLSFLFWH